MTLKEIASAANVSPSTVSMVLSNKKGVGKKTRALIISLLEENGYKVETVVEENVKKSIRFIKYIKHSHLVNGNAGFVAAIIDSVEKECRLQNCDLIMTVATDENLDSVFSTIDSQPTDGIILLATEMTAQDIMKFENLKTPLVIVDNMPHGNKLSYVDMDNKGATYELVEHLVKLGHKKIGYLFNAIPSTNCTARLEAFKEAIHFHNLHFDESTLFELMPTLSGSFESMLEILSNSSPAGLPTAFVATNDSIAIGAIKALMSKGINVPSDISVVGFDDLPFSVVSEPPLTTMKVFCENMGKWAVKLLSEKILNSDETLAKMQIGTQLVVRESTCPAKKQLT